MGGPGMAGTLSIVEPSQPGHMDTETILDEWLALMSECHSSEPFTFVWSHTVLKLTSPW